MDDEQGVARELERSVPAKEIPTRVERFLSVWLQHRTPGETFAGFTRRHTVESLKQLFS
jgi:ferredoxin-nitrite reductase